MSGVDLEWQTDPERAHPDAIKAFTGINYPAEVQYAVNSISLSEERLCWWLTGQRSWVLSI